MSKLVILPVHSHHLTVTFAQLRAFAAVVHAGSFSAAAEELKMTQSAVSHAVRGLERELGTQLLSRGPGGVRLTDAGQLALQRAHAILAEGDAMRRQARDARGVEQGRLRVGTVPSAGARLLPGILGAFRRHRPDVQVTQLEGSDPEVLDWLRTSAIDVAIVGTPADDCRAEVLTRDEFMAVLPAVHPLAGQAALSLHSLASVPFIMSAGGCEPLITQLAEAEGVRLRIHYEVRDPASLVAMVAEGLGATVMPSLALPAGAPGIRIAPLSPPAFRDLIVATPGDSKPIPAARAFSAEARRWIHEHASFSSGHAA